MTTLRDALDRAETAVRQVKADRARTRNTDLEATLLAYRGEDLVAVVWTDPTSRGDFLTVARTVAGGFGADVMCVAFETFHSHLKVHPVTGRAWAQGDMQDLAEHHHGRGRDWVNDALMVLAYNRAGDSTQSTLPYRIVRKRVVWDTPVRPEAGTFHGAIHNSLLAAMATPALDQLLHEEGFSGADFGLDIEAAQAHRDCAIARVLLGDDGGDGLPIRVPRCVVALGAQEGTERARIIRRSLPGGKVVRG